MTHRNKITVEIQYFSDCPNSQEMIRRVKAACQLYPGSVDYREILVESREEAQRIKFRGSPTVLINGNDLENMPEPDCGILACRYYPGGLPELKTIKNTIEMYLKNESKK